MNGLTDIDDDTYIAFPQLGQCHNLGDEVRELRTTNGLLKQMNDGHVEKIRKLESEVHYWRTVYMNLAGWVNRLLCLYGWGGDPLLSQQDALIRVGRDIEGLRKRVRELKKINTAVRGEAEGWYKKWKGTDEKLQGCEE